MSDQTNTNTSSTDSNRGIFSTIGKTLSGLHNASTYQAIGSIADAFPTPNADLNSNNSAVIDIRKGISNALLGAGVVNPIFAAVGAGMKVIDATGGFASASKGLGGTNDTLNIVSSFLPGAGWFSGKTEKYKIGSDTKAMSSSYAGTLSDDTKVSQNAGAKILFGRSKANDKIRTAKVRDRIISNIKDEAESDYQSAATMTQSKAIQNQFELRGGFNQTLARAGKLGMKIHKAKQISRFIKQPILKNGGSFDFKVPDNVFIPTSQEQDNDFFSSLKFDDIQEFQKGGQFSKSRSLEELIAYAKEVNPRFIQRLSEPIKYIELPDGRKATHLMSWTTVDDKPFVYSQIQEDENGNLKDYGKDAVNRALKNKNGFFLNNNEEAELFTNDGYKSGWKEFFQKFKDGGQMNLIPEGNLHARLHHMEDADSLTKKGIPVVDMDGNQQAEIEVNELVLTLEVTNKLEDLYKKFYDEKTSNKDELAIEAGKLLSKEIMENTDDKTGLIEQVQ